MGSFQNEKGNYELESSQIGEMIEQTQLAGAVGQQAQSTAAAQYYVQEQEKTLAESQLDCNKTLTEIYHLLKQDVLAPTSEGIVDWKANPNQSERALTDVGVERIMQLMKSYVNKETLLSNFDEDQINRRMLEFCKSLNANMMMKYEIYFRKPTFEECVKIMQDRIAERAKLKKYAKEVVGIKVDAKEIIAETLQEIESRIDYEINKIRQEKIRQNLREYELLFVQLKAIVEAIHNRAWKGEERGSLRRHTNISEVIGSNMLTGKRQAEGGGMFGWIKR